MQTCLDCGEDMIVPTLFILGNSQPYCPVCEFKRSEATARQEEKAKQIEQAARIKQMKIDRYMTDSCIGRRYAGKTFADFRPINQKARENLLACKGFVQNFTTCSSEMLLLVGNTGTGKSMLAAIIGQMLIQQGFSCLHTTALKVVRKFKDSWKSKDVTETEVLSYFIAPDLLIINEIGMQFGSDTERQYLFEIVDDRYELNKSTVLISNLRVTEVEEFLGDRCMDRIYEEGGVLSFDWESYRKAPTPLKVVK